MVKPKQSTPELSPEWIDRVEEKLGWLWVRQERAQSEALLRPIATFLAKHGEELLELLNEGIQHLHKAFPESQSFVLTLEADRELTDWEYLVVLVKTSLPMEEGNARLNAFTNSWLLGHVAQIGDKLLFDLEYV